MLKKIRNLLLLALLAGGAILYFKPGLFGHATMQQLIPTLIPNDAVVVFEGVNPLQGYDAIKEEKAIKSIANGEVYKKYAAQVEAFDALLKQKNTTVRKLMLGKNIFTSFHLTAEHKLYPIFYIPVEGSDIDVLKDLYAENLGNSDEKYEGETIYHPTHELAINFMLYEDVLIASRSNELLKKVVDAKKNKKSIVKAHFEYLTKNETQVDGFHAYVNYSMLPNLFSKEVKDPLLKKIQSFCDFSYLDISVKADEVHFNGKSYASDSSVTFVSCFEGQQPQQMAFGNLISNRTAFIYFLGFDKPTLLRDELKKYWYDHQPEVLQEWENVKKYLKIDIEHYYGFLGKQVGLAVLDDVEEEEKVVYLDPKGSGQTIGKLNELALSVLTTGRKLNQEEYVGYTMTEIAVEELPYLLFGEQFKGFPSTYFTVIDGIVLMGNSTSVLKKVINDIESEEVWGKSVTQNAFLEKDLIESNISLFMKTKSSWDLILETASNEWKTVLKTYEPSFKKVDQIGVQFSFKSDILYTDLVFKVNESGESDEQLAVPDEPTSINKQVFALDLGSPIITEPYVVLNHVDNSREVFVQTADFKVHLVGAQGELLWSKQLDTAIISDVIQIDVYQNNKLQYVFATPNQIECIDRLGHEVEFYPIKLSAKEEWIHQFNVIDYDKSKNYRLIASTNTGDTYMYNVQGKNLEGWNPNKIDGLLAAPPKHVRINGKDFIVLLQQKGKLNLLNRRGEQQKNFPKTLGGECNTDWYFDEGTGIRNSLMEIIAETGDGYKFNFKGKLEDSYVVSKTQMSRLEMIKSPSEKSFILVNLLPGRITVLNEERKVLFDKEMAIPITADVQLYNIKGQKIIVITDPDLKKTYFLSQNGDFITSPLESDKKIRLLYYSSSNSINVYKVALNTLSLNTIFLDR